MSPILALIFTAFLLTSPNTASALSCSTVYNCLYPCLDYFQGGGGQPSVNCCSGIKKITSMTQTAADRRSACGCLKAVAAGASGSNVALAGALPAKCGVSVPYEISPSADCAKVH